MCVLGYCIFPLVVAAFLCALWGNTVYHIIVVTVAFMWSTQGTAGAGGGVLVGELRCNHSPCYGWSISFCRVYVAAGPGKAQGTGRVPCAAVLRVYRLDDFDTVAPAHACSMAANICFYEDVSLVSS